jgi:3'(2'), 5'-bisphosphate nucleotidase
MTTTSGATSSELAAELSAARDAALAAGALLAGEAGRAHPASAKADGSPVTALDLEADRIIQSRLRAAFPRDCIVTEESAAEPPADGARFWLIDPLDGTRDFAAGSPEFAVHIALIQGGTPVVAVVHQPATGGLFEAVQGAGAWRMEPTGVPVRLSVSARSSLPELRVGVSRRSPGEHLTRLLAESPLGQGAVPVGASLKLTAVAAGELDATLCLHGREKSWDTAAPGLLITEAGGRITDVDGRPFRYGAGEQAHQRGIVTSNGRCHEALTALAARYWPRP